MSKFKTTGKSNGVSRRKLIQGAATATAIVAGGALLGCDNAKKESGSGAKPDVGAPVATKTTGPICYGKSDPSTPNIFPLEESKYKTIYPLLAVWMLMTTSPNSKWIKKLTEADITPLVNLDTTCVGHILDKWRVDDVNVGAFAAVRTYFDQIVGKFLANGGNVFYHPGECPESISVAKAIADLMTLP